MTRLVAALLEVPLTLGPPPIRPAGHMLASWLLVALLILVSTAVVVEVALWRRFREIEMMFTRALNAGGPTDDAIKSLRLAERDTSARVSMLASRMDRIEGEVERLSTFHPPGEQKPGRG